MTHCLNCSAVLSDQLFGLAGDRSGGLSELVLARAAAHGLDPAVFTQRFDPRLPTIYTLALGSGVLAVARRDRVETGHPGSMPWILVKAALVILLTLAFNFVADAGAIRLTLAMT